jgi:hypothetical protein
MWHMRSGCMHTMKVPEVVSGLVVMFCVSLKNSFTTHYEPEWQLASKAAIVCINIWITIITHVHYVAHEIWVHAFHESSRRSRWPGCYVLRVAEEQLHDTPRTRMTASWPSNYSLRHHWDHNWHTHALCGTFIYLHLMHAYKLMAVK